MKKIISLLFFVLLYHTGFSQWTFLDSLPVPRQGAAGFSIGDTGYIVNGSNSGYLQTAYKYNITSNTWTQIQNFPVNYGNSPVGFSIGDTGYVGTGTTGTFGNEFYKYDPTHGTWTKIASLPGPVRAYAVAFVINGKAYVGGGMNDNNTNPLNDFFVYDPATGAWDSIAPCPALGVSYCAVSFSINGIGYVGTGGQHVGGVGSSTYDPVQDFWQYDPSTNTWDSIAHFGGGIRIGAVAFATCDKGFVGTGITTSNSIAPSTYVKDFWQYDPVANKWTQIAYFAGTARSREASFVINNVGYVGTGDHAGGYDGALWEYNPIYTPAFTTANSTTSTICVGGSITFKDTSSYSPTNWFWQFPGGSPDTSSADSVTVVYDSVGSHNVILSAWNTCDSGAQTFTDYVTVTSSPLLTITQQPSQPTCSGQSVTLSISGGGSNFTWYPSTGLSATSGSSVIATPSVTTTYTATGPSSGGCSSTGTDIDTIIPSQPLTILPQPGPLFCSGLSAELKVQGGGSNFIWTPIAGLSDTTGGDSVLAAPLVTTTYYVTGNDSAGCASSGSEVVTVIASPNKPTFYQHGDTLTSSATTDNQWYMNGLPINGDTSENLIINNTSPDSFYVVVENEANGCSSSSDTEATTGINQLSLISNQLSIYPNPFNNDIFIKINSSALNVKDWNLQIIDVLGRTVYSQQSLNYNNDIDLSDLAGGVYFITVINKTDRAVVPIVKQN